MTAGDFVLHSLSVSDALRKRAWTMRPADSSTPQAAMDSAAAVAKEDEEKGSWLNPTLTAALGALAVAGGAGYALSRTTADTPRSSTQRVLDGPADLIDRYPVPISAAAGITAAGAAKALHMDRSILNRGSGNAGDFGKWLQGEHAGVGAGSTPFLDKMQPRPTSPPAFHELREATRRSPAYLDARGSAKLADKQFVRAVDAAADPKSLSSALSALEKARDVGANTAMGRNFRSLRDALNGAQQHADAFKSAEGAWTTSAKGWHDIHGSNGGYMDEFNKARAKFDAAQAKANKPAFSHNSSRADVDRLRRMVDRSSGHGAQLSKDMHQWVDRVHPVHQTPSTRAGRFGRIAGVGGAAALLTYMAPSIYRSLTD